MLFDDLIVFCGGLLICVDLFVLFVCFDVGWFAGDFCLWFVLFGCFVALGGLLYLCLRFFPVGLIWVVCWVLGDLVL